MHVLSYFRFVASLLGSFPGIVFLYSPLWIALTLIGVAIPFATGRFIDALADALAHGQPPSLCIMGFSISTIYEPLSALAILLFAKALLTPIMERFICACSRKIEANLQFRVLDSTMNLPPGQLASVFSGEIVAKMIRDTYSVGGFVRSLYPRLLQTVVMMFAAGLALYSRSNILCFAFMAIFPLSIILFIPFARRFSDNSHRVRKQSDSSFNALFDFLQTLPLLRTLNAERRFVDAPQIALKELKAGNDATDAISIRFGFLLGMLLVGGQIAVLGVAGSLSAKGAIPVGDVVLYHMLFISAIQSIQGVISLLPDLSTIREGVDSLNETFSRTKPKHKRGALAPLETLSFSHVTFAYPHTPKHPVIRDFSASFRAGSVIGLSGANGTGKSTLLKLAVGALEPQAGTVLFNGSPLNEVNISLFRLRIGVVFQDNLIVSGTIRDNITLRDPGFTSANIDKALTLSEFDAVVKRLPDGLDTHIGNHTRTLSGGERQRLAIARAIIRDPMILVLDEATNHLDTESRKTVMELVAKLRPGRLILLAGHDAELDKLCDMKISCQISENDSYINV